MGTTDEDDDGPDESTDAAHRHDDFPTDEDLARAPKKDPFDGPFEEVFHPGTY